MRRLFGRAPGDLGERDPRLEVEGRPAARHPFAERRAEGEHLRPHGERLADEELRGGEAGREPLRARSPFLPRRGETEVDERPGAPLADDHVRRLDVAVKQPGAMEHRELLARPREGLDPVGTALVLEHDLQALPFDQLADHVAPPVLQRPEAEHARHAEPFERRERDRLSHERFHLVLARPFGEDLEREDVAAHAVSNGPNLATAPLTKAANRLVTRGDRDHFQRGRFWHKGGAPVPVCLVSGRTACPPSSAAPRARGSRSRSRR